MMMSMHPRIRTFAFKSFLAVCSIAFLAYVLFPYYWMLATALKPKIELFVSPPTWIPSELVWENLIIPWRLFPIARYFANSIFVTGSTVVLAVIIGAMAGYGLKKAGARLGALIISLLLFTQLLPGIVTTVPFFFWMRRLGLLNTYIGLILPYLAWTLPFAILMLRAYFVDAYPTDLEEAATIDGCSRIQTFIRVVLPLSVPGLIAAGSFSFMLAWKEFLWASIMLSSGRKRPIAIGLRDLIGEGGSVQYISEFMAVSIATTIPAFVVFFFVQKYITGGITAGAVKS